MPTTMLTRAHLGARRLLHALRRAQILKGGLIKAADATVDTDDVHSHNNPWSPSLYTDRVLVRPPGALRSTKMPENFRLSYLPLYEAPGTKYVAMMKRLTLSVAVLGAYASKLFYELPQFDDIYAVAALAASSVPALAVQYKTRDYVSRIFRVYDKEKPQNLQSLIEDEKLVMEKLSVTGGSTYNELLTVSGNASLQLLPQLRFSLLAPFLLWQEKDPQTGAVRRYHLTDDIGGLRMDRLWGIVEHNSGVDNGRYMETAESKGKN